MHLFKLFIIAVASMLLHAASWAASPAEYPNRPIRLVVPYASGGAMDAGARIVAKDLASVLGQPVVVDNQTGGAGTVGTAYVTRQPPDGYTLCFCVTGVMTITPLSDPNVPYKPLSDLVPVSHVHNMENVIMARKDLPAADFKSLLALSKKGELTYGTPGAGGTHHLGGEMLKRETGIAMRHVPYRGEGPAVVDLLGGQIDLVMGSAAVAAPLLKEGKIKVIANLGPRRSKLLPDVKTVAESGFPNYSWVNFVGINAPAKTDPAIVQRLSTAVAKIVQTPAMRERFYGMGFEPVGSTPEEYAELLKRETALWSTALKTVDLQRN
jgi:tripartite-type tricarboxylate transporter receptor subunit TctC